MVHSLLSSPWPYSCLDLVSAPENLVDERQKKTLAKLQPLCLLSVSNLYLCIIWFSMQWILVSGGVFMLLPTFFVWIFLLVARGLCAKGFFDYQAGFCGLTPLLCLLFFSSVCLFGMLFYLLIFFSADLLSEELLSLYPFSHPDVSFPPAFHVMLLPQSRSCNASWEPGNGVRCRGWGKLNPPHFVLSSALKFCSGAALLIIALFFWLFQGQLKLPSLEATFRCSVLHEILYWRYWAGDDLCPAQNPILSTLFYTA